MEDVNEQDAHDVAERELAAIREELNAERFDDLVKEVKSGDWFAKLLASTLQTYAVKATAQYFANKYPGLPADAVVDRQVELAQRFASVSGGVTASAYSVAVASTIGTQGGASPIALPAAFIAFAVDLFYVTKLQLRLAYDMSVLYGKSADIDDPEDVYDLLKVAFGIKATEAAMSAINKAAPEVVRLGVRSVAKGATLQSLKGLPIIGRHLLQRNLIKVSIPLVCVPVSVGMNYWSTGAVADAARQTYRDKALSEEKARGYVDSSAEVGLLASVVWAAVRADGRTASEEACLLRDVIRFADQGEGLDPDESDLGLDLDVALLLSKIAALDKSERETLFDAACFAVTFDRKVHRKEREFLDRLAAAAGIAWDPECLKDMVRNNKV